MKYSLNIFQSYQEPCSLDYDLFAVSVWGCDDTTSLPFLYNLITDSVQFVSRHLKSTPHYYNWVNKVPSWELKYIEYLILLNLYSRTYLLNWENDITLLLEPMAK